MYIQLEHIALTVYVIGLFTTLYMWRYENDRDSRWSIHERSYYIEPVHLTLAFLLTTLFWPVGVPLAYTRSKYRDWSSRRKWERYDREGFPDDPGRITKDGY